MKKKFLCIMLVLMMLFTSIPALSFAGKADEFDGKPFRVTSTTNTNIELDVVSVEKQAYSIYDDYNHINYVVDRYTVNSGDLEEVRFTFPDNRLAYNYTVEGEYLTGLYGEDGTTGVTWTDLKVDYNDDGEADYIYIQKPYDAEYKSERVCVVTFTSNIAAKKSAKASTIVEKTLLDNIAQSYVDSSGEWNIMDMAAYQALYNSSAYKTSDTARQQYVNSAIATICNEKAKETAVAKSILGLSALGYDVTNLYPANSNTTVSAIAKLNSFTHSKSLNDQYAVLMAYAQGDYGNDAKEQVDAIISEVLKAQEAAGSWNAFNSRNDITGMIMHALSFYKDRDGVCEALERATSYLKDNVTEDGAYLYGKSTNSNTIAMVITGLVAAGVNPYSIKQTATSTDIVNGLLRFAHYNESLWGCDGFGYTSNTSKNASATEQSFRAMVAVSHLMALNDAADLASNTDLASGTNLKAYNVFDFTGITKVPARATGGKDPAVTPTDSGDSEKISVRVTIKGLYGSYILSSKKVSISKNSAVYVAFDKACKEAGINVVYRGLNYVESINGLGEFDKGPNSGWLYKVNGELPIIGIGENILTEDSEVLFYFTEDWTLDEDATAFAEPKKKVTEAAIKAPFVDIAESDWYYAAVTSAYALKMVDGVDATHFAPKSTFTRGMMVTMLYKLEGKPAATGANPFADVKSGDWYEDAIKWAYANKVVDGVDTTHFDPLADITREQMAAMLYKYAKYKNLDLSKVSNLSGYTDANKIADWALDAFKWANGNAVLNGFDGLLTPKSTATRAEAAQMLVNFVEKVK